LVTRSYEGGGFETREAFEITAQTINGAVVVALPADAGAELEARTQNGDFSSDLPLLAHTSAAGRIIRGRVVRFAVAAPLKVPHMGWNTIRFVKGNSPLQEGLADEGESFYFVHSFHCVPEDRKLVLAECDYGAPFVAAISRGRLFATQFHPEKSQAKGLRIYRNFAASAAGDLIN